MTSTPTVQIPLGDLKSAAREIHQLVKAAKPEQNVAFNSILNTLVRATGLGNSHGELLHRAKSQDMILSGHIQQAVAAPKSDENEPLLTLYVREDDKGDKHYLVANEPPKELMDYEPVKFEAQFTGQAWVMDNAVTTDDVATFDVTDAVIRMTPEEIYALEHDAYATDDLRETRMAPNVARNWQGPFEVFINTTETEDYAQAIEEGRVHRFDKGHYDSEVTPADIDNGMAQAMMSSVEADVYMLYDQLPIAETIWKRNVLKHCADAIYRDDRPRLVNLLDMAIMHFPSEGE